VSNTCPPSSPSRAQNRASWFGPIIAIGLSCAVSQAPLRSTPPPRASCGSRQHVAHPRAPAMDRGSTLILGVLECARVRCTVQGTRALGGSRFPLGSPCYRVRPVHDVAHSPAFLTSSGKSARQRAIYTTWTHPNTHTLSGFHIHMISYIHEQSPVPQHTARLVF